MGTTTVTDRTTPRQPRWWQRETVRSGVAKGIASLVAWAGAILFLIPIAWMLSASVSTNAEIYMYPPRWIPKRILISNFPRAFKAIRYWLYMRNTTIITFSATIGSVLTASLVAFGFARLRAWGRDPLFIVLLSTMMLPYHVRLVPVYLIFRNLRWLDTYLPLIVPAWLGGGPFYIFLLRQFYATFPRELDDAARMDGCGYFRIWWHILLPLSRPALATVAIFSFFANWNDFLRPLIYLNDASKYTISLGLRFYIHAFGSVEWNLLMAATLVTVLPPLLIFFLAQRTFVQGIVMVGIKG